MKKSSKWQNYQAQRGGNGSPADKKNGHFASYQNGQKNPHERNSNRKGLTPFF